MSAPPKEVAENELVFFFQTNEPIPAHALLNFLFEVDRIARTKRHLGPGAIVEILEIRTGTKLVRISLEAKIGLAALIVAVIALGNDLSLRMKQPSGRFAESVAKMCIDNGVVECLITTPEGQVRIGRDEMPAVKRVQQRRSVEARTGYGNRYGLGYGGVPPYVLQDQDDQRRRRLVLGLEDALPAGRNPTRSGAMDLAGRFVKVAGQNAVVFETGDNVFEVSLTSSSFREVPLDEDVIARCTFDWADASTVFVHSWRLANPS